MEIFPVVKDTSYSPITISDRGSNFLFDFNKEDFIILDGKFIEVFGDAGVVFWIEKTVRTEFESCQCYKHTEYGTTLESVKGKRFPLDIERNIIESNLKRSLLEHERIKSIEFIDFQHKGSDVNISFNVELYELSEDTIITDSSEEGFTKLITLEDIKDFLGVKVINENTFMFSTNIGGV